MNDEKKDKIPLGVCLLFLVGVGLMVAGIWITLGLGFSLMFVGGGLVVLVALSVLGQACKKVKDKELKP